MVEKFSHILSSLVKAKLWDHVRQQDGSRRQRVSSEDWTTHDARTISASWSAASLIRYHLVLKSLDPQV